eukprot:3678990-Prorocentrum_lima.AAC.1
MECGSRSHLVFQLARRIPAVAGRTCSSRARSSGVPVCTMSWAQVVRGGGGCPVRWVHSPLGDRTVLWQPCPLRCDSSCSLRATHVGSLAAGRSALA